MGGRSEEVVESPLMTADELARWLACTRRAVYDRVFRGQVPGAVRVGRRLYFRRSEVSRWLGLAPPGDRSRGAGQGGPSGHARAKR